MRRERQIAPSVILDALSLTIQTFPHGLGRVRA